MREIKFRVWNSEGMISPDYIDREGKAHWKENSIPEISNKVMQYTGLRDKKGVEIYEGDIIKHTTTIIKGNEIIKPTLCEIIGVVKWGSYSDGEYVDNVECWLLDNSPLSELLYQVKHHNQSEKKNGYWQARYNSYWNYKGDNYEVIGNIYENPNLLKKYAGGKRTKTKLLDTES